MPMKIFKKMEKTKSSWCAVGTVSLSIFEETEVKRRNYWQNSIVVFYWWVIIFNVG